MRKLSCWALLAGLCLLAGCSSPITYDYGAGTNFAALKTYSWGIPSQEAKDKAGGVENPIMDRRVKAAVDQELVAKGYLQPDSADPDFLVTCYPVYKDRQTQSGHHVGIGLGIGPFRIGTGTGGKEQIIKEGSIVLEISGFKSRQLLWRANAEGVLTDLNNPQDADEAVNRSIRKMLEKFPPKGW
jgi:hypothetical protein